MATNTNSIILDAQSQTLGARGWLQLLEQQEPSPLSQLVLRIETVKLEDGIVACAVESGEEMNPCEPNTTAARDALRLALMATYAQPADYFTQMQPLAAYVVDGRLPDIRC